MDQPAIMPVCFNELTQPFIISVVFDKDTIPRGPPSTYWCSPGGDSILHLISCKDKIICQKRHWSYFKKDFIGLNTKREHHSIKKYIQALENLIHDTLNQNCI